MRRPAWLTLRRAVALLVLVEQGAEALLTGVSLAQNPALVIAALGMLGLPDVKK